MRRPPLSARAPRSAAAATECRRSGSSRPRAESAIATSPPRGLESHPSNRARRAPPSSAEVGLFALGEADDRRDQVGQVPALEVVEEAARLANELVHEDPLVRGLVGPELLESLGELRPRSTQVPALQMEQTGGDLDEALVEVTLVIWSRPPQRLPRLMRVPVADAIEESH